MGEECANLGGDDFELSLELSIGGGKYGISRSNDSPLQKKRSLKKSRKIESLAERRRRGIGEIDGFLGERFRNNEKSGGGIAINDNDADDFFDLSLSLFTQEPQPLNPSSSSNSPVSDYQTTSQRGGSSTDTGSNSSPLHGVAPAKSVRPPPSIQSQPMWGPSLDNNNNNNNNNPGPVKPVHMPCVTTTGNGADGKTVRGFLHKYSNAEVSIVCVCHGSSFSPAGFVEHAGGVGVSNPLRHITVVRSVFGSL